ncbi:MAG: hypothetical protein KBD12_00385 [Candidatus Pacebacteria bacterium]|nr:hypothetical protein [Candidatus Paceibacterota bacterium]
MNFDLEKNFPTFINKQEKIEKHKNKIEALKALGKKAIPYIAALTALLSAPNVSKSQESPKHSSGVEWKLTSPDGKQTKTFNTREERDAFAKAHNIVIQGSNTVSPEKEKNQGGKVEWKLTSPDGKQTKTFNTREERDAFAKAHNIIVPGSGTVNNKTTQNNTNTVNYKDFINSAPEGKSEVIAVDSNNNGKIYKVKKDGKKVKIKEKGDVKIIRTQE